MSNFSGILKVGASLIKSASPLAVGRAAAAAASRDFHTNVNGNINVTCIPGDGVGPELMDSVEEVLKAIGAPIEFETYHLSEVTELQPIVVSC